MAKTAKLMEVPSDFEMEEKGSYVWKIWVPGDYGRSTLNGQTGTWSKIYHTLGGVRGSARRKDARIFKFKLDPVGEQYRTRQDEERGLATGPAVTSLDKAMSDPKWPVCQGKHEQPIPLKPDEIALAFCRDCYAEYQKVTTCVTCGGDVESDRWKAEENTCAGCERDAKNERP